MRDEVSIFLTGKHLLLSLSFTYLLYATTTIFHFQHLTELVIHSVALCSRFPSQYEQISSYCYLSLLKINMLNSIKVQELQVEFTKNFFPVVQVFYQAVTRQRPMFCYM